ncbi:MAG: hypothetical protein JJU33_01815 [Phycisphaerales bacterium]|nr:hypothetical protein [Phycisphaerales bacterium]
MHDEPALTMTPFDPFEAGAAERLAAVGESGGDPFPVRRVAWNDPPRLRPFAAKWRRSGDGWRTRVVPSCMVHGILLALAAFLTVAIGIPIAVELNPARGDDWHNILFCLAAGIAVASACAFSYFSKARLHNLTTVAVSKDGGVRLSRHRIVRRASTSAERPHLALAINQSFTRRYFRKRPQTVYMLYLCDDLHPRVLIAMSIQPEGVLSAAAELPDDVLRHAEFLLINEPVIAPSFQSWG